jgi:outer membrane protein assembly factor BamD
MLIKLLLYSLLYFLSACSSKEEEAPIRELPTPQQASIDRDASQAELFQRSKKLYGEQLYSVALSPLESLKIRFPSGPYFEFASLKIADAHYESGNFLDASIAYEKFAETFRNSSAADYALFQGGQSYSESYSGVGRDYSPLRKAISNYDQLIKLYPDSRFINLAQKKRQETYQKILESEFVVREFYTRLEKPEAGVAREQSLQKDLADAYKSLAQEINSTSITLSEANQLHAERGTIAE